jgi:hypothetical protein
MPIEEGEPVGASPALGQDKDDGLTVCAISLAAEMLGIVMHEGMTHAVGGSTGSGHDGSRRRAQIGVGARVKI